MIALLRLRATRLFLRFTAGHACLPPVLEVRPHRTIIESDAPHPIDALHPTGALWYAHRDGEFVRAASLVELSLDG